MKKTIIIASIFMLSACTTPEKWEAKTTNPSPLDIAKHMCMQEAKAQYPEKYVASSQPSFAPININGKNIPNSGARASLPSDVNEWKRKDYFNTCMRAEGWVNKNKVTGLLAFLFN
ncbi:hypothetical protein [Proteus faecis]|uniref:Lipoprotein n=1 Tax=Proteus faecis TaxID=2050967 RepID=A0ABZ3EMM5_9GAMM|nr:hypothetical protein [Proteus faecis]MCT8250564.1 hypothetical protein [Proteus faecis]MDM3866783.1 hypothetical protein [Proteus faecis]